MLILIKKWIKTCYRGAFGVLIVPQILLYYLPDNVFDAVRVHVCGQSLSPKLPCADFVPKLRNKNIVTEYNVRIIVYNFIHFMIRPGCKLWCGCEINTSTQRPPVLKWSHILYSRELNIFPGVLTKSQDLMHVALELLRTRNSNFRHVLDDFVIMWANSHEFNVRLKVITTWFGQQ